MDTRTMGIFQDMVSMSYLPSSTYAMWVLRIRSGRNLIKNEDMVPLLEWLDGEHGLGNEMGMWYLDCFVLNAWNDEDDFLTVNAADKSELCQYWEKTLADTLALFNVAKNLLTNLRWLYAKYRNHVEEPLLD